MKYCIKVKQPKLPLLLSWWKIDESAPLEDLRGEDFRGFDAQVLGIFCTSTREGAVEFEVLIIGIGKNHEPLQTRMRLDKFLQYGIEVD